MFSTVDESMWAFNWTARMSQDVGLNLIWKITKAVKQM